MRRRIVSRHTRLIVAVASILFIARGATAQVAGYAAPRMAHDATSVGYAPTTAVYPWGGYAYRSSNATPAGEFGGYLYRSPDDFVNYRGPIYAPIAGADVGLPVADASGRVSLEDVPMWTDEWAARIIRNRAAAGLAVDAIEPIGAAPSHFRTRFDEIEPAPVSAPPTRLTPTPMVAAPIATPGPSTAADHVADTPSEQFRPQVAVSAPSNSKTLVLDATSAPEVSISSTHVDASATTNEKRRTESPTPAPDIVQRPERHDSIAVADTTPTSTSATGDDRSEQAVREREKPSMTPETFAKTVAGPAAPIAPTLTREDLNRATAAGIAIGRGDKAFEHGEYEQARDEYRVALDVAGDAAGVRIALGLSDYALGAFGDAAHAVRQGVSHSPELAKSEFRLQDVYGDLEDAIQHRSRLDAFVTQNPENADALFLLGFVQYFSNQREAARTTFGAYRSVVPHDEMADPFIEIVLATPGDV
ncbi:MAG TPA: hypothetical protein P5081_04965 [Phycisphaerae bacterium]|nr:hypothetical protein [Phycisphaerae bacterium]HRW52215.1 hypothetical protein [Phycisphaerae bacterium]